MILNIDKDFRDLISPLTKEEFEQLENNIIAEGGIHDPIITWNNIIIDGHNRYDICIKNDLKYFTKELDLIDRNQAINWIIDNQLGRRNLAPWQQSILRGKRYNAEKKEHGGDRKSSDQIDHLKTSEKLADQYGVSAPTIRRDGNFAIAAEKASEVLEQPVMQLTKQQILEVAKEIQREKKDEKKSNQLSKDRENVIASSSTIPKLYKMDAMEFLNKISMFDLLLTDPPYSTDIDNIDEFANNWVPLALSKIKNHGRAYIFIGAYSDEIVAYLQVIKNEGWKSEILPWVYNNTLGPNPKNNYFRNWQVCIHAWRDSSRVLDCDRLVEKTAAKTINAPQGSNMVRLHAWQKPEELISQYIRHASTVFETVVDPFAGTGTTLISAAKQGRVAIGSEIDDYMINICKERGCGLAR